MPLLKNTFQPFFLDPDAPMPVDCNGEYCYPVAAGDILYQEFYQTPCAANMVVDPDFEDETLGAELVLNGSITTPTDWTLGTSWTYGAGFLNYTGNALNSTASQAIAALTAGSVYKVTFDVTIAAGSMFARLGSGAGVATSDLILTTGSYTYYLNFNSADKTIYFEVAEFNTAFTLDNISVKLVTYGDWITNGSWALTPGTATTIGTACKTDTGTGKLINGTSDYIVSGDYYLVNVDVSGIVSGSVQLYIDDGTGASSTNVQVAITSNGEYTYYITALQNGAIAFLPSSDFIGCLSEPNWQRLRNDYPFGLYDRDTNLLVADLSQQVDYVDNKVTLRADLGALYEAGTIEYGCYYIEIIDTCTISGENLVRDGDFSNGNFDDWGPNAGAWQFDMSGGEITFIFEPTLDGPTLVTNGDFAASGTGWTADANWVFGVGTATHTPGSTGTLSQTIVLSPPSVLPAVLNTWFQVIVSGRTAGSFRIQISDFTSGVVAVNNTITDVCVPTIGGGPITAAIIPTSDFDGTIELFWVNESPRTWVTPQIGNVVNPLIVAGNYRITYEVTNVVGIPANEIGGFGYIVYPPSFTYGIGLGVHTHDQLNYVPGAQLIALGADFKTLTNWIGRITIDDFSVVRIEPFEATYTSECLNFQASHPGTTLVTAWCDRDALGSTATDQLGFVTSSFILQMRIKCRGYNANLDKEGVIAFFGDGNAAVKYAQFEKYWQFVTDYMSESALIALGGMIHCDHFTIGDSGVDATEYLAKMEDFTPQWRESGDYNLAPALITIRKKTGGMKFNRHT